jgi:LuxR family maltose regulon positive regulatory protein
MPLVPGVKIAVPQLPPEFVVRSELRSELDAGAAGDVVLVCAPAGFGKTLLLADWSRASTAVDTAWVGVDRDDNEPAALVVSGRGRGRRLSVGAAAQSAA